MWQESIVGLLRYMGELRIRGIRPGFELPNVCQTHCLCTISRGSLLWDRKIQQSLQRLPLDPILDQRKPVHIYLSVILLSHHLFTRFSEFFMFFVVSLARHLIYIASFVIYSP